MQTTHHTKPIRTRRTITKDGQRPIRVTLPRPGRGTQRRRALAEQMAGVR